MTIEGLHRLLRATALSILAICPSSVIAQTGIEGLTCLNPSRDLAVSGDVRELRSLVGWLRSALREFDSMIEILDDPALEICLGERLFGMQGYYEVESNRIVLRSDLDPGLMRAVAIHELRHAQQNRLGICLDPGLSMQSSARLVLAMEADASAIGAGIAWVLREAGEPEVWEALARWPGQASIMRAFEEEIEQDGDFAKATAIAFAEWYEIDALREVYYRAACNAYLDRQDQTHLIAGYEAIDETDFLTLCRLPNGDAYGCEEPALGETDGQ